MNQNSFEAGRARRPRSWLSRACLLAGVPLLLAACATPPSERGYAGWFRSESTSGDFAADHTSCTSAATVPVSLVAARGNPMRQRVDENRYVNCMRERDWRLR